MDWQLSNYIDFRAGARKEIENHYHWSQEYSTLPAPPTKQTEIFGWILTATAIVRYVALRALSKVISLSSPERVCDAIARNVSIEVHTLPYEDTTCVR